MGQTKWEAQASKEIKVILDHPGYVDETDMIDMLVKWAQKHCYVSYHEGYEDGRKVR